MAKKNKQKDGRQAVLENKPSLDGDAKKSLFAVALLAFGLISFLGLCQAAGSFGMALDSGLQASLGFGKWFFPLFMLTWAVFLLRGKLLHVKKLHYFSLLLFFLTVQTLLHFFIPRPDWKSAIDAGHGGGWLGYLLTSGLQQLLGFGGGLVLLIALFFSSLILAFNTPLSQLIGYESWFASIGRGFSRGWLALFAKRNKEDGQSQEEDDDYEEEIIEEDDYEDYIEEEPVIAKKAVAAKLSVSTDGLFTKKKIDNDELIAKKAASEPKAKVKAIKIDMPLDLLSSKKDQAQSGDINLNLSIIQRTLENFGINVDMGETSVGPTVTQYAFKPAEGIKLSRITTLSNDLSLALAAHPIRIEAPIPGKALVGIEVPNKTKAMVGLREILEDKEFKQRKSNLMVALGKDVAGSNWLYDLSRMPHLLVAGATNSGKSVCLNAIIVSLLYQNGPEDLRFIMVDPKRVELPAYNGIPHLLTPVITEVAKTINALKWCLNEMDRRYDILNKAGKKNIQSYNESGEKMSYIVFVIDELADLMVTSAKDIEGSIIRLTQMARAVGIHLILATQRPSVDVITGLIKANTPSRIAFAVASAVDSKTILDTSGAEKLLGKGDMLFSTAEISKPKRIQGAYVSDDEIFRITSYIKEKGGEPQYIDGVTERQKVSGNAGVGLDGTSGDEDELMIEAKEIIIGMGKASTSLLQRRLRIGYGRAASILDMLEEAGVVGPVNGSKPREVMISKEQYEREQGNMISSMPVHNRSEAVAPGNYLSAISEAEEGNDDTLDFGEDEGLADENDVPEPGPSTPVADKAPLKDEDDEMFFAR